MNSNWIGRAARKAARWLAGIYYPEIEIFGSENIPSGGPTLFVANHANSLLDPVLIGIATKQPVHFMAKAPLFDAPVLGLVMKAIGMMPVYRGSDDRSQLKKNLQALDAAAELLAQGVPLGIFPEGKSHDLPKVEAMHSGAARIAVKAFKAGASDLKISTLGINYQRKEQFRSSVRICAAEPIELSSLFESCGNDERKALRLLTAEIEARLKQTVIHLDNAQWAPFLDALEILWPAAVKSENAPKPLEQRKLIADAVNHFMDENNEYRDKALAAADAISKHRERLAAVGLELRSPIIRLGGLRMILSPLALYLKIVLGHIPALAGTLFHIIPFSIVRGVAKLIPSPGQMTTALTRLLLGLPVYAAWYALTAWLAAGYFAPWLVWTWFVAMPFAGLFAMSHWRRVRDSGFVWLKQARAIFHFSQIGKLREERKKISESLAEMTQLYEADLEKKITGSKPAGFKARRLKLLAAGAIAVLLVGIVFVGWLHFKKREIPELASAGPNLAQTSQEQLAEAFEGDEKTLTSVFEGLKNLEPKGLKLKEQFASGERTLYRQADNDAVRRQLLTYINYRAALLRIVWKWGNYRQISDEAARLRAMLLGLSAASTLYEASLRFVVDFSDNGDIVDKLNEPEPVWEVPARFYTTLKRNLLEPSHRDRFNAAMAEYRRAAPRFEALGLGRESELALFHIRIDNAEKAFASLFPIIEGDSLKETLAEAEKMVADGALKAQSMVSTLIGDTKIRTPRGGRSLISREQMVELKEKLRPGDIILERRNWFLSNAFLPGYWPHSALYVGTAEDLERLGLAEDERVKKHWATLTSADSQGHRRVIIEAVSEGVIFSSLEHSVGEADSVAVLRPAIPPDRIAESIARAFSHAGKPYDFDFDFFSTDKLVCTELIFRAYDGDIEFPLVDVLGRKTMPALEIARKFVNQQIFPEKQLEFVAFLDGDEAKGKAEFKGPEVLAETLTRPALTWLQGF